MSLTVAELTEIPYLKTRFHAGASGAGNVIGWAHSIELPSPWEWLEPGDLLMTVGLGIPAEPGEQVAYVRELAAVGVSAVAIGEEMKAPPLSEPMVSAADEAGLPILFTAYEIPFVQVSRAVAEANRADGSDRVVRAARVYDRVRAVVEQGSEAELLAALEEEVECWLWVCANPSGAVLMAGSSPFPGSTAAAVEASQADRNLQAPGLVRIEVGGATCLIVPVPSRRAAILIAIPVTPTAPPYALLQHVATVAALQLEQQRSSREELSRTGAELFAQLEEGRAARSAAARQLAQRGFAEEPMAIVSARSEPDSDGDEWAQLHHVLADEALPNLLWRRGGALDLLVPAEDGAIEQVADLLGDGASVGVSEAFADLDSFAGAVREARWARERAAADGCGLLRYGDGSPTFGPRSIAESEALVDRVLGPLLAYDAEHQSGLTPSLQAFLAANRSWKRAAAELFIHKQTLIYRMRRVEELTGRKLNDTGDVAELWLALKALQGLSG